jgi:hypothetical protein
MLFVCLRKQQSQEYLAYPGDKDSDAIMRGKATLSGNIYDPVNLPDILSWYHIQRNAPS